MAWYKLELKGGKGHTNHEIEYMWSDFKWSAGEKKCQWDSWANEFHYEHMYDGHVTYVKQLPVKERDAQIAMYKREITEANRMIAILETRVKPTIKYRERSERWKNMPGT